MRELNPDHLRAFADVAELGSFTAAAARLNLTQPAVSLQVRQLERRLGVRLLERVGRRALPTLAGEELLEHARRIEAAVGDAIAAMARHRAEAAGRVRIGTGATACIYLLPPALRTVRAARPALQIIVHTGSTPEILDAVEENRLDLALVTLPVPGRALVVTPVVEDEQVAIFPADGTPPPAEVTPAALAERPLVLYETGAHTRRLIDAWFLDGGLTPKPVMELASVEAIKEMVGAGLGCAILPRLAVGGTGARPDLVARPLAPPLYRQLGLVLRRDKVLDAGLRAVIGAIAGQEGR